MRTEPRRWPSIGTAAAAIAALGATVIGAAWYLGDTDPAAGPDDTHAPPVDLGGQVRLVAYDSCDAAIADLKRAALSEVGPWGLGVTPQFARGAAAEDSAASAPTSAPQSYTTTNVHEAAADEPDVVKTDGRRIVTVVDGTVRVIDAGTRAASASITLPGHATSVLLAGDRALIAYSPQTQPTADLPTERSGLAMVDLAAGRVLRTLEVDGTHIDARMTGTTARVVLRSGPRFDFTYPVDEVSERTAAARNREVVQRSTAADWLPRYTLAPGGSGTLDCAGLSRPSGYTGTSLLSILTVDLTGDLTPANPVTIAADGDTVYGNGRSLYIADDRTPRWGWAMAADMPADVAVDRAPERTGPAKTEVHQFDVTGPGKPAYLASGVVDGWLLNQYSLSEHEGRLRIATTTGSQMCCWGPADAGSDQPPSESAVSVLERRGSALAQVGRVDGLGKNEQIYSVRFLGDTAHVVTFRRTDPLYTLDLSDPTAPRVTGDLKITGFSAYLHPMPGGRLLGVGQEATEDGRATGVQVSLFDTSGPTPTRVAQRHWADTYSAVEHDAHAFTYLGDRDLVLLPIMDQQGRGSVVMLTVAGDAITEVARVAQPGAGTEVSRSVVIGDVLWTLGYGGAQAVGLDSRAQLAWLPFGQ